MPTILEALHLCLIIPRNLLDSCSSFKIHPGAREGVQEEEDIWVSSTEHFLSPHSHQGLYTVCTLYRISWNNSPKRRRKRERERRRTRKALYGVSFTTAAFLQPVYNDPTREFCNMSGDRAVGCTWGFVRVHYVFVCALSLSAAAWHMSC